MTTAETLAREIARVAALRGHAFGPLPVDVPRVMADMLIDAACLAIGGGDEGRMLEMTDRLRAVTT